MSNYQKPVPYISYQSEMSITENEQKMTLSQYYEVKSCKLIYLYKEILYAEIK